MVSRVLLLDLRNDPASIARYEALHAPGAVPLPIVQSIRSAGIRSMEIFRCGNRLVMTMDVAEDFDPVAKAAADAGDPDVTAWEELVGAFQQPLPWADPGEKWVPAERIFSLAEQSVDGEG